MADSSRVAMSARFGGKCTAVTASIGGVRLGSRSTSRRIVTRAKVREVFMPALSSTMTEGKIVSWLKGTGDKISKGESIVVVESDKVGLRAIRRHHPTATRTRLTTHPVGGPGWNRGHGRPSGPGPSWPAWHR